MDMITVDSSVIDSLGYDDQSQSLKIIFKKGKAYSYANVPENVYQEMLKADSIGTYFHQQIKGKYETFLYNPEL